MTAPLLRVTASHHLASWLGANRISLAFTTYQANRLFLVGVKPDGRVAVFERLFDRPTGLWATPERLWLSTRWQIWELTDALPPRETYKGCDRVYVPRRAHTTGELDIHDVAVDSQGRILFVNTLYSCLAMVSSDYSFRPLWRPPFISRLAPEDRCHLNGVALVDGSPAYATAVSSSDVAGGWRERREEGGCLIDVEDNEIVLDTLSMPHSPRDDGRRLWVLNSGTGEVGYVDRRLGRFEPVAFCPGYLRGLAFYDEHAIVGLSKPRGQRLFSGLVLDERLRQKDTEARCGLWVIDLRTGHVVHWLELEGVVTELYDVAVIPDTVRPMALGFKTDEINRLLTIETSEGPRFEPLRTGERTATHGLAAVPRPGSPPRSATHPLYRRASALARRGAYREAAGLYEQLLREDPGHFHARANLGTVLYRLGDLQAAKACYSQALAAAPRSRVAHANLARVLREQGELDEAIRHWEAALAAKPDDRATRLELATALAAVGRLGDAKAELGDLLRSSPQDAVALNALGAVLSLERRDTEALQWFERAAEVDPGLFEAHLNCGNARETLGQVEEARAAFDRALAVRPEPALALRRALLCPPVFRSVAAITGYLQHAREVIAHFSAQPISLPLEHIHYSRAEVPFHWAYHGHDDLELRRGYAALFNETFRASAPAAADPSPEPPWRVGFVVTATHEGVFLRCMGGVVERLDATRFRTVIACPRAAFSRVRRSLSRDVELVELPQRFDHAVAALRKARCDVLYFWEVGTDSTNYFLAFCRLAPVQCTGWGWPVTAAAPALDYHLTSEALAPPGAEQLFAERLVRLPFLPAFMDYPPGEHWEPENLTGLGVPERSHLYLCVQTLRKAHPDIDPLLAGILRADPAAVVAFVHERSPHFGAALRRRWEETLPEFRDRLMLLPRRSPKAYMRLVAAADVLLDTLHFGGANTAYDAYAAGVPVVTWPGLAPRSRYTAALHEAAGIEGCTASSAEEYVALAVRLGTDARWRQEVSAEMRARAPRLLKHKEAAAQLEAFFEKAIHAAARRTGG